jgi:WD repeat-containing protein mio
LLICPAVTSPSPVSTRNEKSRHIVTFDWHTDGTSQGLKMICMRQNGELQVHTLPGEPVSLAFGSRNAFITGSHGDSRVYEPLLRKEIITQASYGIGRGSEIQITPFRGSFATTPPDIIDPSKAELAYPSSYIINPRDTLGNDVCLTMRRRAAKGYAMDAKTTKAFADDPDLEDMWTWLKGAEEAAENGGMVYGYFDLSYLGVYGIWTGDLGADETSRLPAGPLRQKQRMKELANSAREINQRNNRDDFRFSIPTDYPHQRRLCLAIAGWDFPMDELESRLMELERTDQHAKAAGWALFHHDIKRCIKALTKGGQEMKLMSTAVAGYCAHTKGGKEETSSSGAVWKELCRSMSVEMDDPYLRAVFAFVANGDWKDVLDDAGLPIKEKLGIAFRFLQDEELSTYINSLLEEVIRDGDLTGLLLTGISDKALDLLEKYVNRTADVQTAALVSAFAVPRYFADDRVEHWVQSYRWLLNSWKMFLTRARYDVMRSMKARERSGPGIATPPQVSLRCVSCDKVGANFMLASRFY